MNSPSTYSPNNRFMGRWIGETQGCERPAHLWEITQHPYSPNLLYIDARRENNPQVTTHVAHLRGQDGFAINPTTGLWALKPARSAILSHTPDFKAVLVDSQHFIILGWDLDDAPNQESSAYDVVFSRPGLAELVAHEVWLRYKAQGVGK